MKKKNKNEEMIRNKIDELNDKITLREYLFAFIGDQQLQKDIDELETEI